MQIDALKDFVARHSDIMEIALDPVQLRSIVRANKLLPSSWFGTGRHRQLRLRPHGQRRLSDGRRQEEGVRRTGPALCQGPPPHFPGAPHQQQIRGTAIAGDMLNMANKYVNDEPFEAEGG